MVFCLSNRKITKISVGTREWVSGDKPDHTGFLWDVEDLWIVDRESCDVLSVGL